MNDNMVYTLITGGSRGLGFGLARECAGRGMNLLLISRSETDLAAAAENLRSGYGVEIHYLAIDLCEMDAPVRIREWCHQNRYRVNILINNAGVGGTRRFANASLSHCDQHIMLNVRAMTILTRLFLEELGSHEKGWILNVSSISSYFIIPFKVIYAASKTYVHRFSVALAHELKDTNIRITVVHPNGVPTNAEVAGRLSNHSYLIRKLLILETGEIARMSLDALLQGKKVLVPGVWNRLMIFFTRILPASVRIRRARKVFLKELQED